MVETVRGQGTYICATESMLTQFKEEMARQVLTYFIVEMRSLGFDDCAIQTRLSQKLEGGEKQ
jgi:DNA-binding transcriptional regulator YhcF (GntR family)